jgi:hypothetical protein
VPPSDLEQIFAALQASGARFEPAWARRVRAPVGDSTLEIASLPDLIELKRRAGRPQDLADLRELEAIARDLEGGTE